MTSFEIHDYPRGQLIQDGYLPQHPASMALSAPSGFSMSLPTASAYHPDHYAQSSAYIPRSIAPHPGYFPSQSFSHPAYIHEQGYDLSSNTNSARGRSGSGASTFSPSHPTSAGTSPTSPYSLNGVGNGCQTSDSSAFATTRGKPTASQKTAISPRVKQQPRVTDARSTDAEYGNKSVEVNPAADERTYCPHGDCRDDKGQPKKFFSRKADVNRHYKSCHDITYIDCPMPKCERKGRSGFTRKDHLTEHLRGFHMEDLPKRQTTMKRAMKTASTDSNHEARGSSEDLDSRDSTIELTSSRSRGSSLAETKESLKRGQRSLSAETIENVFQTDEDHQPTTSWRDRRPSNKSNTKALRQQPYSRRPSKSQPQQDANPARTHKTSPKLSTSPEQSTTPMMIHPQAYQSHQHMSRSYSNGHMISPTHRGHADMGPFFQVSSIPDADYHGHYGQPTSRYDMVSSQDPLNGFQYQPMEVEE